MKAGVVLSFLLVVSGDGSVPEKGPPVAQVEVQKIVARVGEDLKILCPVEGSPAPLVRWYKDDEVIDHTWTRIKATRRVLKIKNVNRDDTGIFLCKGVNGFGSAAVRVELIVIDPRKYGVSPVDKPLELAPPVFTKKTQNSRTMFKKLPGDAMVLACEALGSPQPAISWLHNGVSISSSAQLDMAALNEYDSGTYTCVASNLVGRVAKEFSLTVSSPLVEVPVISDISNVSVREGETGVVQCSVSSSVPAQVKWLREVDHEEDFTVSVGNLRLVVVDSGQLSLGDGLYISNLVMRNVHANNQGVYVCFATNTAGGFNYKTATLTMNPIKTDEIEGSTMVLALVIGLTVVVLVLLVVLIICSITARRKILQPESPASSRTLMPQTPSTTRQTVTIQRNYLDFGPYDKEPSDGANFGPYDKVPSDGSTANPRKQNGRCSSANTNHYEVPYSHLTQQTDDYSQQSNNPYHQSDNYSHKSNIPYHQSQDFSYTFDIPYRQQEDYSHKSIIPYRQTEDLKLQANIPYYQSENIDYPHSGGGSAPRYMKQMSPLHLHERHEKDTQHSYEKDTKHSHEKDTRHSHDHETGTKHTHEKDTRHSHDHEKGAKRSHEKDMLTHHKKHKLDNRSDSPGANLMFRQHPYFEYITVRSQETESNHV